MILFSHEMGVALSFDELPFEPTVGWDKASFFSEGIAKGWFAGYGFGSGIDRQKVGSRGGGNLVSPLHARPNRFSAFLADNFVDLAGSAIITRSRGSRRNSELPVEGFSPTVG